MTDSYREIRVRPVVRYIVTLYESGDGDWGGPYSHSHPLGEFDNVDTANMAGAAIWRDLHHADMPPADPSLQFEPARKLKIDWLRGPGEPKEAIRWVLSEPDAEAPGETDA